MMVSTLWTGRNNGEHRPTGAGCGLKVTATSLDPQFKRTWRTVSIELPSGAGVIMAEANVTKKSFWGPQCRELIRRDIGLWMLPECHAPWQDGNHTNEVTRAEGRFREQRT
jgi:hypothetical protein